MRPTPEWPAGGFLKYCSVGRSIDDFPDRPVILQAEAAAPVAEKQHCLSLPPKRLINDVGEPSSSPEFLSDPTIIGFRMLFEVRLPADELKSHIQIPNPVSFADVAPECYCFPYARQKTSIAVQGFDALEQFRKQTIRGFAPERFGGRGPSQANSVLGQLPLVFCSFRSLPGSDRLQETHSPKRGDEAIRLRLRKL